MRKVAIKFPGAVIAFCTLRDTLTNWEIQEIKRLTKIGRKYWKNDRPINPVLILTGKELFGSYYGVPPSWEGLGFASKYRRQDGLLHLCNITQQIYLNLRPWEEEWYEEIEKKRKRLAARQASGEQKFTVQPRSGGGT